MDDGEKLRHIEAGYGINSLCSAASGVHRLALDSPQNMPSADLPARHPRSPIRGRGPFDACQPASFTPKVFLPFPNPCRHPFFCSPVSRVPHLCPASRERLRNSGETLTPAYDGHSPRHPRRSAHPCCPSSSGPHPVRRCVAQILPNHPTGQPAPCQSRFPSCFESRPACYACLSHRSPGLLETRRPGDCCPSWRSCRRQVVFLNNLRVTRHSNPRPTAVDQVLPELHASLWHRFSSDEGYMLYDDSLSTRASPSACPKHAPCIFS